ncbi:MAG: alanine:cation symporter family protein, partial [Parasphingorhabdus sp.]
MIDILNDLINRLSDLVFFQVTLLGITIELVVLWLAIPMLFFTLYLRFINLRAMGAGIRVLKGRFSSPDQPGNMSPFAALSTALSGTVGLGNIAGVAIALSTGGPGAAFWMFVIGWMAMALKCAEVTLGLKYREVMPGGDVRGGPMYTIKNGLASKGFI